MDRGATALDCDLQLSCEHGEIHVHAVRGREALSTPFRYEIDFSSDALEIGDVTRAGVLATLRDGHGNERLLAGVVDELELTEGADGWLRCRIVVVPMTSLLVHSRGSRIFQDLAVPDIVTQVFEDHKIDTARFRMDVRKPHPKRVYCVQYNESSWDFVNRLLEEEGIYYWFEHSAEGDVMVMGDDKE